MRWAAKELDDRWRLAGLPGSATQSCTECGSFVLPPRSATDECDRVVFSQQDHRDPRALWLSRAGSDPLGVASSTPTSMERFRSPTSSPRPLWLTCNWQL